MLYDFVGTLYRSVRAVGRRAHGGGGDRRLRPRPAGAGLRHRSAVPAALQADRLGRVGRRGDPLLPLGHGAEGRPRDALGRRVHPPGQGGHDDPHRAARGALPARRPRAVRRVRHALRQGRSCSGSAPQFVAAKLAEREERLRRAGQSRYLVEPNVKDGKGGLRDLHTLFWIAKYVYRVREPEELVERGVFDREEFKLFRRAEDFLWAVRCHMHFVTGRAEERLSFDIQREIAVRLGYTAHPGMRDVERFMKHYFLIAKDVGDLTAILCAGAGGARGEARAGARPRDRALQAAAAPRRARVATISSSTTTASTSPTPTPSGAIRST